MRFAVMGETDGIVVLLRKAVMTGCIKEDVPARPEFSAVILPAGEVPDLLKFVFSSLVISC